MHPVNEVGGALRAARQLVPDPAVLIDSDPCLFPFRATRVVRTRGMTRAVRSRVYFRPGLLARRSGRAAVRGFLPASGPR